MNENENNVNPQPKGLYIPRPIAVSLFNMRLADAGRVVCNMLRFADGLTIASKELDAMAPEGLVAFVIWKEMFEAYGRRHNG